ncbi:hypothetical protein MES5069_390008 [Mesorhizobium escarrei]|uniref:Uncharacterized protein n=1 Tax=Mesorhizobium escarrei TaxID=666018 RepID=A0ABM9E362_9HYPH|nr:hypothetical protein MES5069_390008 [Mesorhizobium escarrei]
MDVATNGYTKAVDGMARRNYAIAAVSPLLPLDYFNSS